MSTFADQLEQHIADTFTPDPILHRCKWCDWTAAGHLEDTAPLWRAHMTLDHPEVDIRRRPKQDGAGLTHQALFEKTLEDNVRASRLAGGTAASKEREEAA